MPWLRSAPHLPRGLLLDPLPSVRAWGGLLSALGMCRAMNGFGVSTVGTRWKFTWVRDDPDEDPVTATMGCLADMGLPACQGARNSDRVPKSESSKAGPWQTGGSR